MPNIEYCWLHCGSGLYATVLGLGAAFDSHSSYRPRRLDYLEDTWNWAVSLV
jgi:hypothetical protein